MQPPTFTPICIIGAGPAGATTALQLNRLGVPCTIIDKAIFPRDKVCGDGLSGKVITALERIDPDIAKRFRTFAGKQESWGVDFVSPGRYTMHIPYKNDYKPSQDLPVGFVCKRRDFDNFLIDEIKQAAHTTLLEGINIEHYIRQPDGFIVSDASGKVKIKCSLLIIANGAQSSFAKKHTQVTKDAAYSAGIRGYYSHVKGMHEHHFIELHFLRDLLPGYLWIFPLPDGDANVGLDMLSNDISRKKINLRKLLNEKLTTDPILKHRFNEAVLKGKLEGYVLPLAGNQPKISGDNYLLVGDAAFMIDPLTGEGIGNAMSAGRIAASHAEKALQQGDYSSASLRAYDDHVYRILGSEFNLSNRLQKLACYPSIFNWLMKRGSHSVKLQRLVSGMLYDIDLRKQLASPRFYLKLFFSK